MGGQCRGVMRVLPFDWSFYQPAVGCPEMPMTTMCHEIEAIRAARSRRWDLWLVVRGLIGRHQVEQRR